MRIWPDRAPKSWHVKYLRRCIHTLESDMPVKSKTKRSKKRRTNNLKANVVMRLVLHETLTIRNLTKRIQELDRQLTRGFIAFNRISESVERENNQIRDLLLEPVFRTKRLGKVRSRQRCDLARCLEKQEQIGRLFET